MSCQIEGHKADCYYCKQPCNALAGDPGKWPVALPHADEPGVAKWHHAACVLERLRERDALALHATAMLTSLLELVVSREKRAKYAMQNSEAWQGSDGRYGRARAVLDALPPEILQLLMKKGG